MIPELALVHDRRDVSPQGTVAVAEMGGWPRNGRGGPPDVVVPGHAVDRRRSPARSG